MALIDVVKELNQKLGLKPALNPNSETLLKELGLVAELVSENDDISKETINYLIQIGGNLKEEVVKKYNADVDKVIEESLSKNVVKSEKKVQTKTKKKTKSKKGHKSGYTLELEKLVSEAKYTLDEIVDIVSEKYPDVDKMNIRRAVYASKNPKYTRFKGKIIVEDENEILRFEKI